MSEVREKSRESGAERGAQGGTEDERLPLEVVREVVDLLNESGVGEITVRHGDLEVSVKAQSAVPAASGPARMVGAAPAGEASAIGGESAEPSSWEGMHVVRSPIVGTFYSAPAPGEDEYVRVGDRVAAGETLCIIEAMKLMNEIPAEASGVVRETLAENAAGVQYDEPLFVIEPEG